TAPPSPPPLPSFPTRRSSDLNPHSGGQGVYTRHLSRELAALGHRVTVFAGQPYPVLDTGVEFVPVPSLDLYREPDPFRVPHPRRSEEHTSELQSRGHLVCRLL